MNTNKKCRYCTHLDKDICLITEQKVIDVDKSACDGEYYEREPGSDDDLYVYQGAIE